MYKITDSFCKHIVNGFKQNKMVSYGKIALTHLLNKRKKREKRKINTNNRNKNYLMRQTYLFFWAFLAAWCCCAWYPIDSSQGGTSCFASASKSSRSLATFRFFSLKNDVANPVWPTRPVRPIRWTYSSISLGISKLITCFTFGISKPRAAT